MSAIKLKGMTWSHPRGYDPMVACSKLWKEQTGVEIEWEKRSLQDFESFPVEELARKYDLIVIDHPHVGQITAENCLAPLDVTGREAEQQALSAGSVGQSYPSYHWQGRQWAFPIDTATQVCAWRPDLLEDSPASWDEVMGLAKAGRVLLPLRPPHSLMTFYTLSGNLGSPCAVTGQLIDLESGIRTFEMMREIVALIDPACFEMDPIAALERMGEAGSHIACSPLIYGYVNYSIDGFRPNLVAFADIPAAGDDGPAGSALGGTGIGVSAFSANRAAAIDFAYWIAGGEVQRGPYASEGGQPAHTDAWEDETVNKATTSFYAATRKTLEAAWVRPRHKGYMDFQEAASGRLNAGLLQRHAARNVIDDLNALFRQSFAG
ncbi:multiple sugar transport system substrate-binding protein [Phyllobacterium trifolii]|jgi:multiple sugar transport system substrate-binding protein|uniref:Multiple sugar transport system substrate-binding protein n=1 Tax=Phyllobacterium trifolii TaxID=300193 RepID=A0A839U7S9_9HYPH|nr:extracellular solute-binding protein [Phyllobacterium trifolii]MBB3144229.1 multiple sugar transport system substrate-binding protein [Phyllobacterium trifolii]